MTTQEALTEMLKTDTGSHFLDSGGAYGRHHERNQERDFAREPESKYTADEYGFYVEHNTYRWLLEQVEYDEDMDKRFLEFAESGDMKDKDWYECLEAFCNTFEDFDEDSRDTVCVNTYNEENCVEQVIQYYGLDLDDGESLNTQYYAIMIHQGCDVRGGYTRPWFFVNNGNSDTWPYLPKVPGDISLSCNNNHFWDCHSGGYSSDWETETEIDMSEAVLIKTNQSPRITKNIAVRRAGKNYLDTEEVSRFMQANPTMFGDDWQAAEHRLKEQLEKRAKKHMGKYLKEFEVAKDVDLDDALTGTVIFIDDEDQAYCPECGEKLNSYFL